MLVMLVLQSIYMNQIRMGGSMSQKVGLPNNSYEPITNTAWFAPGLCKLQKGCTRLAAANAKAYQLLAHGRWFSHGTPASCTSKNGCHDLSEILQKMALNTKNHSNSTDQNDPFSALFRPLSVVLDITG